MANKQDGSSTGLRIAEESSPKTLPGTPLWEPYEPNTFSDFGGKLTIVAREPIDPSRQRRKGTITDLEASAAFNTDVTPANLRRLLQGYLFADAREKKTTAPLNAVATDLGAVVGGAHTIAAAAGLDGFLANALVKTSGFAVAANNGLGKVVTSVAALLTLAAGLADEADAPSAAKVEAVGYEFAVGTLNVTNVGTGLVRLNRASGAVDFTTLGLIPGEWIFVGGDSAGTRFVSNVGWARIAAIAAGYIDLDKTSFTPANEVGAAITVRIFFGRVYKNEADPTLIKMRSYQLERTVGKDAFGTMSELVVGAVPNDLSLHVKIAGKVEADLTFVGMDHEVRSGTDGLKAGTRPTLVSEDAVNTSSDFSRIKIAKLDPTTSIPTPLFAFASDLELSLKNNLSPVKAIGSLGAIDMSAGLFDVSGKGTFYFADETGIVALKDNADVTIDVCIARKNAGLAIDVPLIGLGDGRLSVEKGKPITLPLEMSAAAHPTLNHTLLVVLFPYLPTAAE